MSSGCSRGARAVRDTGRDRGEGILKSGSGRLGHPWPTLPSSGRSSDSPQQWRRTPMSFRIALDASARAGQPTYHRQTRGRRRPHRARQERAQHDSAAQEPFMPGARQGRGRERLMSDRNWGLITTGETFESLATTLVFFEDPKASLLGGAAGRRPRRAFGRRHASLSAKYHDGAATARRSRRREGGRQDREYRQPGHDRHDQWNGVTHWRLVTNAAFNPTDRGPTWDSRGRSAIRRAGAHRGLLGARQPQRVARPPSRDRSVVLRDRNARSFSPFLRFKSGYPSTSRSCVSDEAWTVLRTEAESERPKIPRIATILPRGPRRRWHGQDALAR